MKNRLIVVLGIIIGISLIGCDNGTISNNSSSENLLIGTWISYVVGGTPNQTHTVIQFKGDGTFEASFVFLGLNNISGTYKVIGVDGHNYSIIEFLSNDNDVLSWKEGFYPNGNNIIHIFGFEEEYVRFGNNNYHKQ